LGLCVLFSFVFSSLVLSFPTLSCLVWYFDIVFCHVLAYLTLLSVLLCSLVLSGLGFSLLKFISSHYLMRLQTPKVFLEHVEVHNIRTKHLRFFWNTLPHRPIPPS
jgi:hypothetical protein